MDLMVENGAQKEDRKKGSARKTLRKTNFFTRWGSSVGVLLSNVVKQIPIVWPIWLHTHGHGHIKPNSENGKCA